MITFVYNIESPKGFFKQDTVKAVDELQACHKISMKLWNESYELLSIEKATRRRANR